MLKKSVFRSWRAALALALIVADPTVFGATPSDAPPVRRWVGTWASAQQVVEPGNLPPAPGFVDVTLRQIVRVSIGGTAVRVRLSNEFGRSALVVHGAFLARSAGGGAVEPGTSVPLRFSGQASVSIPEGAPMLSDPVEFPLAPASDVAVTIRLRGAPADVTGHPGSRTTSYLQAGDALTAASLPDAVRVDHWYFLSGIDVVTDEAAAVAVVGDSITDGRGSTTNGQDRWPDQLARRLLANPSTAGVSVLNLGLGGNRLLRDGLGPNMLARLDRDVLARPGVRWLVVLAGINDIGTAAALRAKGEAAATADDVIGALAQLADRARAHGMRVYGATIMPFEGFTYAGYFTPEGEADRQRVNAWIRTSGRFDAVIDFDAATRDPESPTRLSAAVDGGDHLHPSAAGYRLMADAVDLALFQAPPAPRVVEPGAQLRRLAGGFAFTEGPTVDRQGHVYFTDQPNNRILKWSADGVLSTFLQPAGRANGLYIDAQGRLLACADERTELWLVEPGGTHTVLAREYEGKPLNGPNDLWIRPDGGLYFTDPFYKRPWWDYSVRPQDSEQVYFLSADRRTLRRVTGDFVRPNGITGTPDGRTLYVADRAADRTFVFDIQPDGSLANKRLLCELGSDGMTIDDEGNLYLTGRGGVTVVDRQGSTIGHIPVPEPWTANVAFGGPDRRTLYVTASQGLYAIRMRVGGANAAK